VVPMRWTPTNVCLITIDIRLLVQTQYALAIFRPNLAATFTGLRDEHHVNITGWQFTHFRQRERCVSAIRLHFPAK
jgi:hypothetical protein